MTGSRGSEAPGGDAMDAHLRAWPGPPLPEALAARTLARARAAFDAAGLARPPRWPQVATAAAVVSATAIYLAWAVAFLSDLARG
jgi:hypothetical protein